MKRHVTALALLATASPAAAQYSNVPPGQIIGNPETSPRAARPATPTELSLLSSVPNNTALKAKSTTSAAYVTRVAFATPGDSSPVMYQASTSACSLNAGAGDDGSQVRSSDSKCWLAQPNGDLDVRTWGKSYPLAMYVDAAGNDNGGANYCLDSAHKCATITQAVTQLLKFNVNGQQPVINFGAGTFAGNISINGPLRGSAENNPYSWSVGGAGAIKLAGAGSGNTLIQSTNSAEFCFTLLANYGGELALSGLTVTYIGPCVGGAPLYAQANGKITIGTDVVLAGTSTNAIVAEEQGFIWVQPGIGGAGSLTINGSFGTGIALGTQSMFQADALVTMNGTYSNVLFALDDLSDLKLSHNPPIDGNATGKAFECAGNSAILTYQPGKLGANTQPGTALTGCVWRGNIPPTTIASSTGTGTGGTTQGYFTNPDPYHGTLLIMAGTSAASTGAITLNLPYALTGSCVVGPQSVGWRPGSSFFLSFAGPLYTPAITWDNNGTALTASGNYLLAYVCR